MKLYGQRGDEAAENCQFYAENYRLHSKFLLFTSGRYAQLKKHAHDGLR
jgi:hypothetical protein